jgi:hypothetical protein
MASLFLGCSVVDTGDERGRTVVADEDKAAGAIMCREKAYASVVHPQYWESRCSYCYKKAEGEKLLRCSQCKCTYFCDKHCFKLAWKDHHKLECKVLSSGAMAEMPSGVVCEALLVGRTLRELARADGGTSDIEASATDVDAMFFDHDSPQEDDGIAEMTLNLVRMVHASATKTNVLRILSQFACNNFGIMDDLLVCIGAPPNPAVSTNTYFTHFSDAHNTSACSQALVSFPPGRSLTTPAALHVYFHTRGTR